MRHTLQPDPKPDAPALSHEAYVNILRSIRRDCARARNRSSDSGAELLEDAEVTEIETGAERHHVAT